MRLIPKLIFSFFSNFIAIIVANNYIAGFSISTNFKNMLIVVGIFTLLNLFIKPIFTTVLSPFIILTLGLLSLLINAAMLYLLDFLSSNVTITGIEPLLYATLIISFINLILHFSAKLLFKPTN